MQKEGEQKRGLRQMLHISNNFIGNDNDLEYFLEKVNNAFNKVPKQDGKTGNKTHTDKIRTSKVQFHHNDYIANVLYNYVSQVNYRTWNFDIHPNFVEMQLAEYAAEDGGHFDWHIDQALQGTDLNQRKIACTIQLSSRHHYKGGEFELDGIDLPDTIYKKGTLLLFPSLIRHRVRPITEGTRRSLVVWFYGSRWR